MLSSLSLTAVFVTTMMTLSLSMAPAQVWGSPITATSSIKKRGDLVTDTVSSIMLVGEATFFHPKEEGGEIGSCGPKENDKSRIVALNSKMYGSNSISKYCGKEVLIKHGDKETIATITDKCPMCGDGSLDLTPAIFEELGALVEGVIDIIWCFLDSPECKPSGSKKHGDKQKEDDDDDERT
ncbi:hypothetical protein BDB00DRAFT_929226 [Zychaea mexicana]|uniref:uncharacterized protein n=1 Tax=Zychaea mexicana TaxID=64656 RepID=UPI0022FDCB10|nr:uncharacterized protein BDB00DRAFT_929226 [Zychaea mexicana]KAI9493166.1 hypothetical protein BDB00DRAFT_929226 [Zychaea mexicana]